MKPWKKHTICQLEVTWRTPGSLVSPHLQWRILSIIYHLGEGWLQLIQSVTLIGHHHVPHSVLNAFPDQFPFLFTCISSPASSLNPSNPTSSPKSLWNGLKCYSPLNSNQDRCNLSHLDPHQPTSSQILAPACLPLYICEGGHWSSELLVSYFMISSLSIAGSSPQWIQEELQALHTPHWSSVFAALSWCNLQSNMLLSLSKLLSTF